MIRDDLSLCFAFETGAQDSPTQGLGNPPFLVEDQWHVDYGKETNFVQSLYDSFDWRLYREGWLLTAENGLLRLTDRRTDELVVEASENNQPRFADELASQPLRETLAPVLEMRALIDMAVIRGARQSADVRNEDDKIIVRATVETRECQGVTMQGLLTLHSVRGYANEMESVAERCKSMGMKILSGNRVDAAFEVAGRIPLDYSGKPKVALAPGSTADHSLKMILDRLLDVMRWNTDGIKQDIDTEFLHDFRVAVRRSRSLLAQMKQVFEPEAETIAVSGLRRLGKLTNRLRDLDVYLLEQEHYLDILPAGLREGAKTFFNGLATARDDERKCLNQALNHPDTTDFFSWWGAFLASPTPETSSAAKARMPITLVAGEAIRKRYKRICRDGGGLVLETPDQEFHDLRIQCKKLRYLFEMFASLYDKRTLDNMVSRLKRLQNSLGTFNDLSVQQEHLEDYILHVKLPPKSLRSTAVSIGALVGILHDRQRRLKAECLEGVHTFINDETRAVLKKVLQGRGEGS